MTLSKAGTGGTSNTVDVSFYAGENSACGTVVSTDPTDAAKWSTPSGSGTYATPPSLNNPAEGGSVTVTIAADLNATTTVSGPVTKGTTGAGTGVGPGSGSQNGAPSPSGSSTVPVSVATAASGEALAFTGFDFLLVAGTGALLLLSGTGLLAWRRRLAARR